MAVVLSSDMSRHAMQTVGKISLVIRLTVAAWCLHGFVASMFLGRMSSRGSNTWLPVASACFLSLPWAIRGLF